MKNGSIRAHSTSCRYRQILWPSASGFARLYSDSPPRSSAQCSSSFPWTPRLTALSSDPTSRMSYVSLFELIIVINQIFHLVVYLLADHLLLPSVDDVLLHFFSVVFLGKLVCFRHGIDGLFVHLMNLDIELLLFDNFLPHFD